MSHILFCFNFSKYFVINALKPTQSLFSIQKNGIIYFTRHPPSTFLLLFYNFTATRATTNDDYRVVCWLFYRFVVLSIKCQKIVKNTHYNFSQPKVVCSYILFCPINITKPKDIQFTIVYDKEKDQMLTSEKLEAPNVIFFFF